MYLTKYFEEPIVLIVMIILRLIKKKRSIVLSYLPLNSILVSKYVVQILHMLSSLKYRGRRGHDRMVVRFITTYATIPSQRVCRG